MRTGQRDCEIKRDYTESGGTPGLYRPNIFVHIHLYTHLFSITELLPVACTNAHMKTSYFTFSGKPFSHDERKISNLKESVQEAVNKAENQFFTSPLAICSLFYRIH